MQERRTPSGQVYYVDDQTGGQPALQPNQEALKQLQALPTNAADPVSRDENHPRMMEYKTPSGQVVWIDARSPELKHQDRKISVVESLARGAAQGATLGWSDELEAAIGNPFDTIGEITRGETYDKRLADVRRENRNAALQHAGAYLPAEAVAGLVTPIPGGGAASTLGAAARGAVASGVAGAGYSERPGWEALYDVPGPAIIGGAASGLAHKLVTGAPERQVRNFFGDLTDGAPATARDKAVAGRGPRGEARAAAMNERFEVLKDVPGLIKNARTNPDKALTAVDADLARVREGQLAQYEKLEKLEKRTISAKDKRYAGREASLGSADGVPLEELTAAVRGIAGRASKSPVTGDMGEMLSKLADAMEARWYGFGRKDVGGFGVPVVPVRDVRQAITDLQTLGFAGSIFDQGAKKSLQRQAADALHGVLDSYVKRQAAAHPELGISLPELNRLNKRMSTLLDAGDVLNRRGARLATPSTRLRDQAGWLLDLGLLATQPEAFVAKKAVEHIGVPLARGSDVLLARLANAARQGKTSAELGQMAVEMGLSRATGEALGRWAQSKINVNSEALNPLAAPPATEQK